MIRRVIGAWILASAVSCQHDATVAPGNDPTALRVLFLGNSLTYTNNLPGMVTALAAASGEHIVTESSSYPDFAVIDHWNDTERAIVRNGHFDVVILQQGPTSLGINRDSLRLWTAMWAPEIRAAGGRPALFAVWPEAARMYAFPDVSESYHLAAQDVNGLFFPVGDTWLEVWNSAPTAQLYGGDDFHPSVAGTYAAAVVIVAILAHRDAITLSSTYSPNGLLDPGLANTIRTAASTVIQRLGPQPAQ